MKRKRKRNLILIQERSQRGKGALRKTMMKRRMRKMTILMTTVSTNLERLQKNTQ